MGTKSKMASLRKTHTARIMESYLIADLDCHSVNYNMIQLKELRDVLDCFESAIAKSSISDEFSRQNGIKGVKYRIELQNGRKKEMRLLKMNNANGIVENINKTLKNTTMTIKLGMIAGRAKFWLCGGDERKCVGSFYYREVNENPKMVQSKIETKIIEILGE